MHNILDDVLFYVSTCICVCNKVRNMCMHKKIS